uniref:MARVEL domain-containing protein n=1 Tax=Steinernema glaseri TaxID=37863 RepID=A0A1I7Y1D1_9BILA
MSRKGILNSTASSNTATTTFFPEGHNRSNSSHSTETFGAFDQMELNRESRNSRGPLRIDPNPHYFGGRQPPSYPSRVSQKSVRHSDDVEYFGGDSSRGQKVYLPTTVPPSEASTSAASHRAYDKLSEVYSHSGDTVEFARNFGLFLDDCIPPAVWVVLFICLCFWGLAMIMMGAFNIELCPIQKLIPIYMIVQGGLFIASATFRIYAMWPLPPGVKRSSLAADIVRKGCELLLLLAIVVWLILGCDWIYSIRGRVHFNDAMFEQSHCEWSLYWAAWMSVTLHLISIALLLLLVIGVLIHALCKTKD